MKAFKITDCIIQFFLIAFCTGISIKEKFLGLFSPGFYIIYYSLGGWQLVSAFIHFMHPQFNKKRLRQIYLFVLALLASFAIVMFFVKNLQMFFLLTLLFLTPVIAVYYCIVCTVETAAIKEPDDIPGE